MLDPEEEFERFTPPQHSGGDTSHISDTEVKFYRWFLLVIGLVLFIEAGDYLLIDSIILTMLVGYMIYLYNEAPNPTISRKERRMAKRLLATKATTKPGPHQAQENSQ